MPIENNHDISSGVIVKNIISNGNNNIQRLFTDYTKLETFISHIKGIGLRIVLTSGTFDMLHIGHARYFEEAKKHGDFLIVGVDSDEKVKARKGPERPIVPESERMEMLSYLRSVDAIVLKPLETIKWHLIKITKPDVLIATKNTYEKQELKDLKKYCGEVLVLEPMATTSTSAKIRRMQIGFATKLEKMLGPKIISAIEQTMQEFKEQK
jgi:D-glycero-beta-D-manno-heptose 1-phosphate adenylyltransferase